MENFSRLILSLIEENVKEIFTVENGDWLIVQRYLSKENPKDPRLFLPRVNPEALHWSRGERDFGIILKTLLILIWRYGATLAGLEDF